MSIKSGLAPKQVKRDCRKVKKEDIHYCTQCGREMAYEWILGPVCGKCCRANHKKVCGC